MDITLLDVSDPRYLKMSNADPEKQRAKLLGKRQIDGNGCWNWPGQKTAGGYGTMRTGPGTRDYVHRIAQRLWNGPIPEGWHVDHLCKNTLCYNPVHLEAVTPLVNWERSDNPGAMVRRTGKCGKGHDLADAYVTSTTGVRRCRTCVRQYQASPQYLAKRRESDRARRARGVRTGLRAS